MRTEIRFLVHDRCSLDKNSQVIAYVTTKYSCISILICNIYDAEIYHCLRLIYVALVYLNEAFMYVGIHIAISRHEACASLLSLKCLHFLFRFEEVLVRLTVVSVLAQLIVRMILNRKLLNE